MSNSPYAGFTTSVSKTPQSQPIPGEQQVKNAAGGYVYKLDKWGRLERFLILGSENGTYYVGESAFTKDNALSAISCIQEDGKRAVDLAVAISVGGRAPKTDPAIFVLALAAAAKDVATRQYALSKLNTVCRIPTHLFHFVEFCKGLRGWGPTLKNAVGLWYSDMDLDKLAYELVKYQQRDGWSNRDLLRKSHPSYGGPERHALYRWVLGKGLGSYEVKDKKGEVRYVQPALATEFPTICQGFDLAKDATLAQLPGLISKYNLSREMLPTEALKSAEVWEALLEKMPYTAMLRNLGNMSKVGLLKPLSNAELTVVSRLTNNEMLKKARVHPYALLLALKTYGQGKGNLGKGEWTVSSAVVDALDDAFYLSFQHVEPTGKRFILGVDVSGSMSNAMIGTGAKGKFGEHVPGPISAAEGAAAMALAVAKVEKSSFIHGFSAGPSKANHHHYYATKAQAAGDVAGFIDLGITPKMRLDDALKKTKNHNFGATDCSLPARWALANKIEADAIIILTDNETWQGPIHASQALKDYRQKMGIPIKQVVVAMTSTGFTIADPDDALSLDVVGFDASAPALIQDFVR